MEQAWLITEEELSNPKEQSKDDRIAQLEKGVLAMNIKNEITSYLSTHKFKGDISTFKAFKGKLSTSDKGFIFDIMPFVSKNTNMIHTKRSKPASASDIIKMIGISKAKFYTIMGNLVNIEFFHKIEQGGKVFYKIYEEYFTAKRTKSSAWKKFHQSYIQSKAWKAKRLLVLARDNNACQECASDGNGESLHVHHLTYKNFRHEPLEDLISLCNTCHSGKHGIAIYKL